MQLLQLGLHCRLQVHRQGTPRSRAAAAAAATAAAAAAAAAAVRGAAASATGVAPRACEHSAYGIRNGRVHQKRLLAEAHVPQRPAAHERGAEHGARCERALLGSGHQLRERGPHVAGGVVRQLPRLLHHRHQHGTPHQHLGAVVAQRRPRRRVRHQQLPVQRPLHVGADAHGAPAADEHADEANVHLPQQPHAQRGATHEVRQEVAARRPLTLGLQPGGGGGRVVLEPTTTAGVAVAVIACSAWWWRRRRRRHVLQCLLAARLQSLAAAAAVGAR